MGDLVLERTAANRHLLADFFDRLTDEQLATPSLCGAWSVREVLAHQASAFTVGLGAMVWRTLRARGDVHAANAQVATELAARPVPELTALVREHARTRVKAPGIGPMGQMVDGCVHLRDCARPLGLRDDVSLSDWRMVLDWLPGPQAARGVVPKGLLDDLALRATDQDWSWGSGAPVAGPSEALALAITGRAVALADLSGAGVEVLRVRLAG